MGSHDFTEILKKAKGTAKGIIEIMDVIACFHALKVQLPDFSILTAINSRTSEDNLAYSVCFGPLSILAIQKWG